MFLKITIRNSKSVAILLQKYVFNDEKNPRNKFKEILFVKWPKTISLTEQNNKKYFKNVQNL